MRKIKSMDAVYTGGGIWLFAGSLTDGSFFLTDDYGCTQILNVYPNIESDDTLMPEWQKDHLIEELEREERIAFCNQLCDFLKENQGSRNGMPEDLIDRYREFFEIGI